MNKTVSSLAVVLITVVVVGVTLYVHPVKTSSGKTSWALTTLGRQKNITISTTTEVVHGELLNEISATSTASSSLIVTQAIPCGDDEIFEFSSVTEDRFSMPSLKERCGQMASYFVSNLDFVRNNSNRRYGVVIGDGHVCSCREDIGYFNYRDVYEENGITKIASSSIVRYASLSPDFTSTTSVHFSNQVPHLVILTNDTLYKLDLVTKVITKVFTLTSGEKFFGQDLPNGQVNFFDAKTLKVKVYLTSSTTTPHLSETRTVVLP